MMSFKLFFVKLSYSFLILTFFCSLNSKAQDTLYLNNGKTIIGKVKEISPEGISFLKAERAGGPTYSLPNSDVNFIRYSNGDTDTIRLLFPTKPIVVPKKIVSIKKESEIISIKRNNYQYKSRSLGEKNLLLFLEQYNKGPKDKTLKLHINKSRENRQFQYVAGFVSIAFAATAIAALIASSNGLDNQTAMSAAASGGVFFAAAQITSGVLKISRIKHLKSATRHYNSLVEP